jgi:hypothetical protein
MELCLSGGARSEIKPIPPIRDPAIKNQLFFCLFGSSAEKAICYDV